MTRLSKSEYVQAELRFAQCCDIAMGQLLKAKDSHEGPLAARGYLLDNAMRWIVKANVVAARKYPPTPRRRRAMDAWRAWRRT